MSAFEYLMDDTRLSDRDVSESEAIRLLAGYTRNPQEAIDRMRMNPWGQIRCEGGTLRYNPTA